MLMDISLIMNARLFLPKEDFSKLNTLRKLLKIQGTLFFINASAVIIEANTNLVNIINMAFHILQHSSGCRLQRWSYFGNWEDYHQ